MCEYSFISCCHKNQRKDQRKNLIVFEHAYLIFQSSTKHLLERRGKEARDSSIISTFLTADRICRGETNVSTEIVDEPLGKRDGNEICSSFFLSMIDVRLSENDLRYDFMFELIG